MGSKLKKHHPASQSEATERGKVPVHETQNPPQNTRLPATYHVLNSTVFAFCVLSNGDNVHICIRGFVPLN